MRKLNSNQQIFLSNKTLSLYMLLLIHVITKGYGVQGTNIKVKMLLLQQHAWEINEVKHTAKHLTYVVAKRKPLHKIHVIDGQNKRYQSLAFCQAFHSFFNSGSPHKAGYKQVPRMGKVTRRLGLQDPPFTHRKILLQTYFRIIITLKYYQPFTYFPSFSCWVMATRQPKLELPR